MKQAIAYYRVSTRKQGKGGLGLKAQEFVVRNYCKYNDFDIVNEIIEVKSTRKFRNGLQDALEQCKIHKCTFIAARLDRMGRDVEEIAAIIKSEVEVLIVDTPNASDFLLHIQAAVAQDTRDRISINTRNALALAKRKGVVLGKNGKALAEKNKRAAENFAIKLSPLLMRFKEKGITTVRAIAKELNKKRIKTFRGEGRWHPTTVHTLLNRLNNISITITA
ncbi:recombinase family protein [Emticicia sp. 17c]|uniref:recombinase family protein n=1 Tax=Emticicia sp. 17c TaxID=3127704 RepID=UPI00301BB912